jgi:hypothetical protein
MPAPSGAGMRDTIHTGREAGRTEMKKLLLIGALAAIALVQAAQPSEAYFRGKWCAKIEAGGGAVGERCDFPNFEVCRAYINAQPKSWCVQNQWNAGNWGVRDDRSEFEFNRRFR